MEQRQPEPQQEPQIHQQMQEIPPMIEPDVGIPQPRVAPEPVDLLSQ